MHLRCCEAHTSLILNAISIQRTKVKGLFHGAVGGGGGGGAPLGFMLSGLFICIPIVFLAPCLSQ